MKIRKDISGHKFGKLTAINPSEVVKGKTFWLCQCECGGTHKAPISDLKAGKVKSCGCSQHLKTHGLSGTPTGHSWGAMINRCYNESHMHFKSYGGRGVVACEFIKSSPVNLVSVIGERPSGKTLDRIDVDLGYNCGRCDECRKNNFELNVKWSEWSDQAKNKRGARLVTIAGVTRHLVDWAKLCGVGYTTMLNRVNKGFSEERLLQPARKATN